MNLYEKKYKNALEWARQVMNGETGFIRKEVEEIFPELVESEEEKIISTIRKALEAKVEDLGNGVTKTACLAWLEKQASPVLSNSSNVGKNPCSDCTNEETPTIAWNENDEVALESAATNYAQDKYLPVQTAMAFKAGAEWMIEHFDKLHKLKSNKL